MRISFVILLACTVCNPSVFAQAVSGNIFGTVLDPNGAAVPAAAVTVNNRETGVSRSATTNDSGNYTVTDLASGTYDVSIAKTGFSKFVQQNVAVSVAQSTRVDASLQVGQETQEITVTEAPPGIETDRAEVQSQLGGRQIQELPVLNRNLTNLTLLAPGATLNTFQHAPSENPQQSTLVNTNGQEFSGTNYLLDGMNNNDQVLGITMVNPPIDSVNTLVMSTSNYDAEYTQAGGAVINVQTRAGTNDLHGSAFEYLQNNIFQARDAFTQGLHAPGTPAPPNRGIPELRWNQFGGSLGGPIVKNKLFLFGDYQGTYRRIGASQSVRVPTAAERTGDLSDLGIPIYDPATGNADGSGRTAFTGGIIPGSRISAPAAALLAALPQPNTSGANAAANNYATSGVEPFDTHQFDIRGDQYLTDKLRYFVRYSFLQASITAPGPFGLYGGPAYPAWGFTGASDARNQNVAGNMTYTFSPSLLMEIRFGMSRYRVSVSSLDANQQLANTVGIPGLNLPNRPDTNGLPNLTINGEGGFSMGYSCNCPLMQRETVFDYVNNWTWIKGNHTFKFGGTAEPAWNQRLPSDNHRAGVYNFSPTVTSLASDSASGLGLASFMLGLPSSFARFAQLSTDQEDRQNRMFFFAQDTWRV
ncbi:MAG TPA: carboxypeptidase-like regulatory domain-containing protein, partial [Bryobacteraceae bacterium]|nr:carboxypeptidase-like regulatory domain-containing protein [Bryobacteraceae bacterium]